MSLSDSFNPNRISALRDFQGPPQEFWQEFASTMARAADARCLLVLARSSEPDKSDDWRILQRVPMAAGALSAQLRQQIRPLSERALTEGFAEAADADGAAWFVAVAIQVRDKNLQVVAVMDLPLLAEADKSRVVERLFLMADLPKAQQVEGEMRRLEESLQHHVLALDLLLLLNDYEYFGGAALMLCNELASRSGSALATIGWVEGRNIRLKAISQMASFERKMDVVREHEAAMEEALDQDEEVILPAPPDSQLITRQHEALAANQKNRYVISVPLRLRGEGIGVITLQRDLRPYDAAEILALRVLADQLARPLSQLYESSRWLGVRIKRGAERWLKRQWNLDNPWPKIAAVSAAVLLLLAAFVPAPYRIEAPFTLRANEQVLIGAPFDGFINSAPHRAGDLVERGQPLLQLDERALRLEEIGLLADSARYDREAELHREEGRLAQMLIAQAQMRQAQARLEQVRDRLAAATVRAPFDGYLVEDSDLFQRLGAPVREGDVLIRFSRLDGLFVDLQVAETEIHNVAEGATGEIAFASRPEDTFKLIVTRVEPMASTEEGGAVFVARGQIDQDAEQWLRPGMTGLAKVDAGKRSILWIFTHRLVDWLRLKLWW